MPKIKRKHTQKELTIGSFTPVIAWRQLKEMMYKKDYEKFCKWMRGQTCTEDGVFPSDLERFLLDLPIID